MPDDPIDALLPKEPLDTPPAPGAPQPAPRPPEPAQSGETPEEPGPEAAPEPQRGTGQEAPKNEPLPYWFRNRLKNVTNQRDAAHEALSKKGAELAAAETRIDALERRIEDMARVGGPDRNEALRSAEAELAELQRLASEEPDKLPQALASYAQQVAEKVVDTRMGQIEEAQNLSNRQMEWLGRAIEVFPEVQNPRSDLAQHASAKWAEELSRAREGQISLAHLDDGRYRCIAEAAAELEVIRREAAADAPTSRRRRSEKANAMLETGTARETPAQELTGAQLFARARHGKESTAQAAQEALVDKLIPEEFREGG